jgi:hypothetical protein
VLLSFLYHSLLSYSPTGDSVVGLFTFNILQMRGFFRTDVDRIRASLVEATTRRRVHWTGYVTEENDSLPH